jgi:hypothetical protein
MMFDVEVSCDVGDNGTLRGFGFEIDGLSYDQQLCGGTLSGRVSTADGWSYDQFPRGEAMCDLLCTDDESSYDQSLGYCSLCCAADGMLYD